MLGPLMIIKKHLYMITHIVGLQNNLHVPTNANNTQVTVQHNSMNKLRSTLVN